MYIYGITKRCRLLRRIHILGLPASAIQYLIQRHEIAKPTALDADADRVPPTGQFVAKDLWRCGQRYGNSRLVEAIVGLALVNMEIRAAQSHRRNVGKHERPLTSGRVKSVKSNALTGEGLCAHTRLT